MRILVTGSNGFVGRKLVSELVKKGHSVKTFTLSKGQDILDKEQVVEAVRGMDVVYHLAAIIDEQDSRLFEVNVNGTKNIVEASAKAKVKQFVFLSSCGVYGKNEFEVDENTPLTPETGYEKSKAESEKIVSNYLEAMPITIVRCPLVLGNSKNWEKILKYIKNGIPLPGYGKNILQIVFVNDLVDALIFVLGKNNAIGETFIVCQDDRLSLMEICIELKKAAGIEKNISGIPFWLAKAGSNFMLLFSKISGKKNLLIPQHVDRIARNRKYNISKIKALGWAPKHSTKEAIELTVREILENEKA